MKYIKKQKTPCYSLKSKNKISSSKTESNCFSITVRTGNGLILGSKAVDRIIKYLEEISEQSIVVTEMSYDNMHLQGGVFLKSLRRQDNLRAALLPMVVDVWKNQQEEYGFEVTARAEELVKKHALFIVSHDNWNVLVNYCMKGYGYDSIILSTKGINRERITDCKDYYSEYNNIKMTREHWVAQAPIRTYLLNPKVIENHTIHALSQRYPNRDFSAFKI